MASFDKESLYTNIPRTLILKNNIFCFNNTVFRQEIDNAMGTYFVLVYGTLTIGYVEEQSYNIIENEYEYGFDKYFKTY